MTELNAGTLLQLPPKVAAPTYDRSRLKRGIAHFGVGNFHRAHQAFYIDRCLALPSQEDWGIVGIGDFRALAKPFPGRGERPSRS